MRKKKLGSFHNYIIQLPTVAFQNTVLEKHNVSIAFTMTFSKILNVIFPNYNDYADFSES